MGRAGLEGPPEGATWDDLLERGLVLEDAPHPIAALDPIDDPDERPTGEGADGIEIFRHPLVLLLEERRLWAIWDLWQTGALRTLDVSSYAKLSDFAVECLLTLSQSQAREDVRRLEDDARQRGRAPGSGDTDDEGEADG